MADILTSEEIAAGWRVGPRLRSCIACSGSKIAQDTGSSNRPCNFCSGTGLFVVEGRERVMTPEQAAAYDERVLAAEEFMEAMREEFKCTR